MFLEKLEIFGFKSFAEKIEVRLSPGITGVIGPNGCGKTNISDALRWVLGEQNMRHLRGDVAEDVIFGGSSTRKPLGMAEAILTISNSKNILPTEYTELQVGRRIYRSGESQYLLNKQSVRLKDVRNLFFDTGMGSNAYSVIERQMVDNILADGSNQRRFLFEEAAGITKYKARKRESLNKLEATEGDLLRVNDLVVEIEKELTSLRYQAGKARRWEKLHIEIKGMDLRLAAHAQKTRVLRVAELEGTLASMRMRLEAESTALATAEAGLEQARLKVLEGEKALSAAQAEFNRMVAELSESRNRLAVGEERARGLLAQLEQGEADQARMVAQLTALESERGRLMAEEVELSQTLSDRQALLEQHEALLREAEEALREKRDGLNSQRQLSLDLMQEEIQRKSELERIRNYLTRCEEQLGRVTEQEQSIRARMVEVEARAGEATEALMVEREALEHLKGQETALETHAHAQRVLAEGLLEEERVARDRAAAVDSRLRTLQELKSSFEGFEAGVRALFQDGSGHGARGVVADLLEVPREWVDALEVFMGPALQAVVVDRDDDAYKGRGFLMDGERGRASFVPLERLARHAPVALPQEIAAEEGVLGHAAGLVRAKAGFEALSEMFLGHVVLVESDVVARRLTERYASTPWGFLTPQGEFWGPHRLHLGSGPSGTQILHREHEIRDLVREGEAARAELARIMKTREDVEGELARCRTELTQIKSRRSATEETALEAERQLNRVLTDRKIGEGDLEARVAEAGQLTRERDALKTDLDSGELQLVSRSLLAEEARGLAASLEEQLSQLEERRERCQREASEMRVEWARVHTRRGELGTRRSEVDSNLEGTQSLLSARSTDAAARLGERTALLEENTALSLRAGELEKLTEARHVELQALENAHLNGRSDEALADVQVKDLRRAAESGRETVHAMELEHSEVRGLLEQELARLKVEYELENLDVLAEQEEPREDETPEKLAQLKTRIRGLGPVNPLAMDEYIKRKERYDFLSTQRDDLVQARTQLLEVIEKINTSAREMVQTTFKEVREKFRQVFTTVFEGGEADLLMEGDDPLEAKIEIVARPRGKRLQNISLLSSGERALTAISLLFGVYLVKPSPFCILDEVDAPLDDANIDRFVTLLKHFAANTQFVVITHNKRTMEACDVLYGVTMGEPGCSRLVSVKFDRVEEPGGGNGGEPAGASAQAESAAPEEPVLG